MSDSLSETPIVNPMDMSGRTVMVTGASSGIGRATSVLLSQLGARVILVARRREALEETLSQMQGDDHLVEPYDMSDAVGIPAWMHGVIGRSGSLNGLVHSAGIQIISPLRSLTLDMLEQTLQINLSAALQLAKGFRQKGHCQPYSSVVFLASVMAFAGEPGQTAYAASKGALVAATRALALELARDRVRVNCVVPAVVLTEMVERSTSLLTPDQFKDIVDMHPLGVGQPIDVANAIVFLLADTGKWITGSSLVVDGGYLAH